MSIPDVAIVSPYPQPEARGRLSSGVASYTADLARSLVDRGCSVVVVAPRIGGEPERSRDGDVAVWRCFAPGPVGLKNAGRAANATGAPVVHFQHEHFLYGGPGRVPAFLAAVADAKRARSVVTTMHQVVEPRSFDRSFTALHRVRTPAPVARFGISAVQRAISSLSSRVIVHEPPFVSVIEGATWIPHGIDFSPAPDRRESRSRLGLDERAVVLCFGFVAPYKGLELALEAATLTDRVELVVAGGEHPRLERRESYAADLRRRYEGVARFVDYVPEPEVATWFAATDVALFLYPRPHAASGALARALGYGTPVLLSAPLARITGAPQSLMAPDDAVSLAHRLEHLAAPDRSDPLRADTASLASERSWPEVARRHIETYEEVSRVGSTRGVRVRNR